MSFFMGNSGKREKTGGGYRRVEGLLGCSVHSAVKKHRSLRSRLSQGNGGAEKEKSLLSTDCVGGRRFEPVGFVVTSIKQSVWLSQRG